jgi:hypothetical protein
MRKQTPGRKRYKNNSYSRTEIGLQHLNWQKKAGLVAGLTGGCALRSSTVAITA